jgi:hypothetical protein
MRRSSAALTLTTGALAAALLAPFAARADAPQVNAALLFLQATCGMKDAKLEARRSEGRLLLTLRTPQFTRQTNLVHNDLRLFTEESMKKNSEMPPELGACFDPASNQVINVLMELPANVASLPMAPPPAPPAAQGGGYVPPMASTPAPAPAPTVVQATPAPAVAAPPVTMQSAPAGTPGEPSYAVQGCRVFDDSDDHVVCEVRVTNKTGRDLVIAVNRPRTKLYDVNGNQQGMDNLKLSAQNVEWRENTARVKVINDTAPLIQVNFNYVPKAWKFIKRLDLMIGYDTMDGPKMQVVQASDMPIRGR